MANKNRKPPIRLTEIIAVNKTADARKLLKKYGKEDAFNYADLEHKLTKLYKETDDKKQLEKEIAEMHPHKKFILDNLTPTPEPVQAAPVVVEPIEKKGGNLTIVDSGYESAEGDKECNCHACKKQRYSNACGCGGYSNFSGSPYNEQQNALSALQHQHNQVMTLATLGLIGLFAFMIYKHKNG